MASMVRYGSSVGASTTAVVVDVIPLDYKIRRAARYWLKKNNQQKVAKLL